MDQGTFTSLGGPDKGTGKGDLVVSKGLYFA